MIKEQTQTEVGFRYVISQLILVVLGLILSITIPKILLIVVLVPMFLFAYFLGFIAIYYLIIGRKDKQNLVKKLSAFTVIFTQILLTVIAVYFLMNQTFFN